MKLFSQRDPLWAEKKMGTSPLTIGRFGCTTTCIAMLSSYFSIFAKTPAMIADAIQYTAQGLIIWTSCKFEHFEFYRREYGRNEAGIDWALKDPDWAVILEVGHSHWVVAVSKNIFTRKYKIADPWFGDLTSIDRYKDNITGAAYFKRK